MFVKERKRLLPPEHFGLVELEKLEQDIVDASTSRNPPMSEQNNEVLQPPPYLQHAPEVSKIGRLSADAVASEYEAAAKAIEDMGKDLVEMQRKLESEIQTAHAALDEIKQL